jgi:hypothetical protein
MRQKISKISVSEILEIFSSIWQKQVNLEKNLKINFAKIGRAKGGVTRVCPT